MATGKYWQTLTLSTLLVLMSSIAFFGTQISDVDTTELQIDETDGKKVKIVKKKQEKPEPKPVYDSKQLTFFDDI